MAKRRSDLIRQHQFADTDYDVDESIELLPPSSDVAEPFASDDRRTT